MSPTGPNYASTAADGGGGGTVWSNPNNALVEDATVATCANVGPGGGGGVPNQLNITNFGFNLPASAIIDGIMVEMKVRTTSGSTATDSNRVYLLYNGGSTATANTPNPGLAWPTSALTWITHGNSSSLWGRTWTGADINNANFGVSMAAFPFSSTSDINVDSVRITITWHSAPADVPKRYVYKVFNRFGTYIGNLPKVISEFQFSWDINTAGTQINVECAVSPDTSLLTTDVLTDEAGVTLTDESNNILTTEGQVPIVAPGTFTTDALIKDGNVLQVWEYSYFHPNGKIMFLGEMERNEASYGGSKDETIKILAYSDGSDLDNYLVRGNPYTYTSDVFQSASNVFVTISQNSGSYNRYGQTWKVGGSVTNLGAITLSFFGTANVTLTVYDSPSMVNTLGAITQFISAPVQGNFQFAFPNSIVTTPGATLFFALSVDDGQTIQLATQNTAVYANGTMYGANYGGGSGGGNYIPVTGDIYFQTFSGSGSTIGTYTSQDPSTGMIETFMNDYIARGGLITYNSSTIQATGFSMSYTFNTNTILEGIKAMLTISPNGFYWYVDLGTDILYYKQANTTADLILTKNKHFDQITLISTIENIKNQTYFSGGIVTGSNIYVQASSATSVALYGPRLDRMSDNRITDTTTARQVATGNVLSNKDEQYQTTVTIVDKTIDTSLLKPGMTIGFNGFGTYVDKLITQIVNISYTPEEVTLTLGILPKRLHPAFEKVIRGLVALQTIANPSTPS